MVLRTKLPGIPPAYSQEAPHGPWPRVEALLVGATDRELPDAVPSETPQLRFVQRIFTGLDDFPFARFPPAVAVAGNVGAFAPFVAEHAVALVLGLAKQLLPNFALVRAGRLRPVPSNRPLLGRTALILGFGEIGREVAARLRSFGMTIEGVSRTGEAKGGADRMFPAAALSEALARADVAVDCRPLTRATRASIGGAQFSAMKPAAILVNVGRAATVDEEALYRHLQGNPEFRAGFDPWWDEDFATGTLRTRFPFPELPNFLGTPHNAGIGAEIRGRVLTMAAENLARFFAGAAPRYVVDRSEYRFD